MSLITKIKMSIEVWGEMPKSQIDPEKPEEMVARLIAEHEADPEAHTGENESLQAHRQNEIIDHPAYSVIDDKIKIDKYLLQDWFGSLDAYDVMGSAFSRLGYAEFYTTTVLNSYNYTFLPADDNYNLACDITKNPIFETVAYVNSNGNFTAKIGLGPMDSAIGVGFKITKTASWVVWHDTDETEHLISITDITKGVLHKFRIEIVAGQYILWFVDNVQVAQLDISALDVANMQGWIFSYMVQNNQTGYIARIGAYRVLYQQDI